MDYRTRPISREIIRCIAKAIRKIFKCKNKYYFNVIDAFEKLPILFSNISTEIVDDDDLELKNIPAATFVDLHGNFCIKVKETVYEKAYNEKNGGYRMHIMHEIAHVILFMLGYLPLIGRTYNNFELKSYCSVEWQAKALAGETLIPYDKTIHMGKHEIMQRCKVSGDAAEFILKLRNKKMQ